MIVATIAREESSVTRPWIMSGPDSCARSVPAVRARKSVTRPIALPVTRKNRKDRLIVKAIPATIRVARMVVSLVKSGGQELASTNLRIFDTAARGRVGSRYSDDIRCESRSKLVIQNVVME